jgi:perosamine synthetase
MSRPNPSHRHVRSSMLPYGRQWVSEEDVAAVVTVLRGDWLTTGPAVSEFERRLASAAGTKEAVAVNSGTAALHAAMFALGIGAGDEVIVPALTFVASANCVVYQGGTPVFADVELDTLLLDPQKIKQKITPRTRAILAVDYAGHPCDYDPLADIADRHGLPLLVDACHSLGATYRGRPAGSLGIMSVFSFHPVKPITTAEGGAITTNDSALATRLRLFRNHGISSDHRQREQAGSWYYEMTDLGYNYRLSDIHCALGLSQLARLSAWVERRRQIARRYDEAFASVPQIKPLAVRPDVGHAYHLYVIQLQGEAPARSQAYAALRSEGIGVNVHYLPVHLHPFYCRRFGSRPGLCPAAEAAYERILSLPIFPRMTDGDVEDVIRAVIRVVQPPQLASYPAA